MNGQQIFRMMLGVAVTLGAAAFAHAQNTPVRLTLDEAIARGLQTSHQLGEFAARADASQAAVQVNDAADRPQVTALAGYMRTNHVDEFGIPQVGRPPRIIYPDVPDNYRTRLDLQWAIYSGGRTDALHVLEESRRRVEAHLTDVRNRLAVGLVPPNDVLSAEAQRSRQEGLLIDARMRRGAALVDLARLVGLPADTAVALDIALTPAALPPDPPTALAEQARAGRPERRAIERRIAAADARHEAAATATKPQVSVVGGVDYANPNPRIFPRADEWQGSWDAGVTVAWSLLDGGRVRAQVAETAAVERAFRERLLDLDARIEVDVRQRRLELESSLAAIRAAEDGVRSAAEARRVVTDRFNAGVAMSTEVLDAQTDLLTAELERTRALANSRLAEARLNRALGR